MNGFGRCFAASIVFAAGLSTAGTERALHYPEPAPGQQVDDYHGVKVADPFRAFEELTAPATQAWVKAQNALSQPYLGSLPARARIIRRLTQLWRVERIDLPKKRAARVFYLRNDGTQNQSVLTVDEGGASRVLLDPNGLSKDGTIAVAEFEPSPDGRYVAYALSDGGTDWKTWRLREVATGKDLPDELHYTKFTEVSWMRDSSGFFYSRYPAKPSGEGDASSQVSVQWHRAGTPQSADKFIFQAVDHPRRNAYGEVTDDGRYLIMNLFDGYDRNGIHILDLKSPGAAAKPLIDRWDAIYNYIGSVGEELYFQTTLSAPNGRVVAIDPKTPQLDRWREVVPQDHDALHAAGVIGGNLVIAYLQDAKTRVRRFDANGANARDVALPGLGTAEGFFDQGEGRETFFVYADFLTPNTVYRFDAVTGAATAFRAPPQAFDASPYESEQVFYTSKDGTRVPMFLTHRRGLTLDGTSPAMLYGYGGFAEPITPAFSPAIAMWLEMGGVYASANLRGGSEYGESWHDAGTKLNKQNVFDDFIAAAQWLIDHRYTAASKLVIRGRSNGGLLVGAAMTQRPDLFAAALPSVGVLDLLRYHTASANARQWSSDYGLSENPEEFRALYEYSPVHRVRKGWCYPATLITTADHDDRVVPWHSYKFGAALQAAQGCEKPILVRVETRAGHGAGKPISMQVEDYADQWAFAAHALGMAY